MSRSVMRRSICHTAPSQILAGQRGNWHFTYVPAQALPKGTSLLFDMLSKEDDGNWEIPTSTPRASSNGLWLLLPNGKKITGKESKDEEGYSKFLFTLPIEIPAEEKITFLMGAPTPEEAAEKGNQTQCYTERKRPFYLFIDPKGNEDFSKKDPEVFHIDIKGNYLHNIRLIGPSLTYKNNRFDLVLRFEDEYGNLTGLTRDNPLIELSYDQLRENLNWKLFVPETGYLTLPNLYFNESGIYRIKLTNLNTKEVFHSPPISCSQEQCNQIFWGCLHTENKRHDMVEDIENSLRHMRDAEALQFFATSTFEQEEDISSDEWKLISSTCAQFNEEERFVTMLGCQWFGNPSEEGLRQIVYAKDNKQLIRKRDTKFNSMKKIQRIFTPKEILTIPSFTMGKGYSFDFEGFNPQFDRVVEIYNEWGSSECSAKKGNPFPIKGPGRKGVSETEEGSIRKALDQNCRFGFIAGGMDTRGIYQNLVDANQTSYKPGITSVSAAEYSRDMIFQALYNRKCYATTGARIVVDFNIANISYGEEIALSEKPGLAYNRHINGFVAGTDEISEILIVRNGKELTIIEPNTPYYEFAVDDMDPLSSIALKSGDDRPSFVYYYIRVRQKDGHTAWVSPIWLDLDEVATNAKKSKKK